MKVLKFNRLVLMSDSEKSANQFNFQNRFNLITGIDNSIGKSSLIKSILWTFGCEPKFDDTWKKMDCKTYVEFYINENKYKIARYKNLIYFAEEGQDFQIFPKVTGDYSKLFSQLVNFKVLLPNRNEPTKLENPPPNYYFLPYYIDQLRSWGQAWNSFDNLGQYSRWQSKVIDYHTGYITPEYFDIEEEIIIKMIEMNEVNNEIEKIDTAITVLDSYIPQEEGIASNEKFTNAINEITFDFESLQKKEQDLYKRYTFYQEEKQSLTDQLAIVETAIHELEEDYKFSVEYFTDDKLECPICGTIHDNSLINRTQLLADKSEAKKTAESLKERLVYNNKELEYINNEIKAIQNKIDYINHKYDGEKNSDENVDFMISKFASNKVKMNVEAAKATKQSDSKQLEKKKNDLKKDQKKLVNKEKKNELHSFFIENLVRNINLLDAIGVNLNGVNSPRNYNKILNSGGASEGTRGILAYYFVILKLIYNFGHSVISPFLIDTPNQQEHALSNYDKIIDLLLDGTEDDFQIILCAMDNEVLNKYKKRAYSITLDNDRLLQKKHYESLKSEIGVVFESIVEFKRQIDDEEVSD